MESHGTIKCPILHYLYKKKRIFFTSPEKFSNLVTKNEKNFFFESSEKFIQLKLEKLYKKIEIFYRFMVSLGRNNWILLWSN